MAKKKLKQKGLSEIIQSKVKAKKANPFEVHFNRHKTNVLGRKTKHEQGLPGVSRAHAIKKRKATLLQEYKLKDKSNKFMDRRIGEKNRFMTSEDKLMARFTAERTKFYNKKSKFNLADDEFLTHKGQTLNEIEKFDNPNSEDDDEDMNDSGRLDADFVADAHFGGGMLKKVEGESRNRKDLIEQLIAESKKRKVEKQKLKEETHVLTDKLDSEWKELANFIAAGKRTKKDEELVLQDKKSSSYDLLSRELKFEARGQATDKLVSVEEEAQKEKEKLEKLEEERYKRMFDDSDKTKKHKSADDLDDGLEVLSDSELFLKYDAEGKSNIPDDVLHQGDDSSEEEVGEDEDGNEEKDEEGEDEDSYQEDEDSEVDLSDLKESDDEEDNTTVVEKTKEEILKKEEIKKELLEKEENKKKAENELPFVFEIPTDYEQFEQLVFHLSPDYQAVVIERMIKCNHPSLKEGNKDKLATLFTYLLQHLQDTALDDDVQINSFVVLDRLSPYLYDLTQTNPQECSKYLLEVIREKHQQFLKKPKLYPGLDTFIFFKLVSFLFPTSDFRHMVVIPTLLFMGAILSTCAVKNFVDISRGLFVCCLMLEFTHLSKRFSPDAVNFCRGILRLCQTEDCKVRPLPPFKNDTKVSLHSSSTVNINDHKLNIKDLLLSNNSDAYKAAVVTLTLHITRQFFDYWNQQPASFLIFEPFLHLLNSKCYSKQLQSTVEELRDDITKFKNMKLEKLVMEKKKPKPLKLYEPHIEEITELKCRRMPTSKVKQERQKLIHKHKKEMKGALREIRRDKAFIAKIQFKEKRISDMERKAKVKEIFGTAAQETGEIRKLKRTK